MKALLLASLLLMSDVEMVGFLDAHQQKDTTLTIDEEKTGIEVLAAKHDMTCQFSYVGNVVATQEHTDHCFLVVNAVLPAHVVVSVKNNENNPISYRTRVYSVMNLK